MNRKVRRFVTVVGIIFAITVFFTATTLHYVISRDVSFRNDFGYTMQIVDKATTFENLRSGLVQVKELISTILPGDTSRMYSTIIPWGKTPDATLKLQIKMIDLYIERIDISIIYYNSYKHNATAALVNDWYTTTLDNLKTHWRNSGDFWPLIRIYTIEKFGAFGDISVYVFPSFMAISMLSLGLSLIYLGNEGLTVQYRINYKQNNSETYDYRDGWSKNGAIREFRKAYHKECEITSVKEKE